MSDSTDRRLGRPDQEGAEALHRRLIETAAKLFAEQGYAATSVDQVAAAAGAGKQTIYRRYPTKADLFKAVVNEHLVGQVAAAWVRKMHALSEEMTARSASPLEALRLIARKTVDFMLDPDHVRLHRLLIAEERLSPVSMKGMEASILVFESVVGRQLGAAIEAGEIPPQPLDYAEEVLISMLGGWTTKQALLMGVPVSAKRRDEFFDRAWSVFINGVRGADRACDAALAV